MRGFPALSGRGEVPADTSSVARVRPRTSKGITDLLSLRLVWLSATRPSKKCVRKPTRTRRKPHARPHAVDDAAPAPSCPTPNGTEMQRKRRENEQNPLPSSPPPHVGRTARRTNKRKTNTNARPKQRRRTRTARARRSKKRTHIGALVSRPESRSLSESTRRIAPPTKNGHAPPPTESRKSYRSVNPTGVRTG